MRTLFLIVFISFTSLACTKIKDIQPPDDKNRQLIIGEWQDVGLSFSGYEKLVFLNNGLYERWVANSTQPWHILRDSMPYEINEGNISLPHDNLGPTPHKILQLDRQTFRYHAESTDGTAYDRIYNRQ